MDALSIAAIAIIAISIAGLSVAGSVFIFGCLIWLLSVLIPDPKDLFIKAISKVRSLIRFRTKQLLIAFTRQKYKSKFWQKFFGKSKENIYTNPKLLKSEDFYRSNYIDASIKKLFGKVTGYRSLRKIEDLKEVKFNFNGVEPKLLLKLQSNIEGVLEVNGNYYKLMQIDMPNVSENEREMIYRAEKVGEEFHLINADGSRPNTEQTAMPLDETQKKQLFKTVFNKIQAGMLYANIENPDKTSLENVAKYEEIRVLDPKNETYKEKLTDISVKLAGVDIKNDQQQKAIEKLEKVIEMNPNNLKYYDMLLQCARQIQDEKKENEYLKKVIEYNPAELKYYEALLESPSTSNTNQWFVYNKLVRRLTEPAEVLVLTRMEGVNPIKNQVKRFKLLSKKYNRLIFNTDIDIGSSKFDRERKFIIAKANLMINPIQAERDIKNLLQFYPNEPKYKELGKKIDVKLGKSVESASVVNLSEEEKPKKKFLLAQIPDLTESRNLPKDILKNPLSEKEGSTVDKEESKKEKSKPVLIDLLKSKPELITDSSVNKSSVLRILPCEGKETVEKIMRLLTSQVLKAPNKLVKSKRSNKPTKKIHIGGIDKNGNLEFSQTKKTFDIDGTKMVMNAKFKKADGQDTYQSTELKVTLYRVDKNNSVKTVKIRRGFDESGKMILNDIKSIILPEDGLGNLINYVALGNDRYIKLTGMGKNPTIVKMEENGKTFKLCEASEVEKKLLQKIISGKLIKYSASKKQVLPHDEKISELSPA